MKCDKAISYYLQNDEIGRIPFKVRIHTFFCPVCSGEIMQLMLMFRLLEEKSIWEMDKDIKDNVMDKIQRQSVFAEKRISGLKWVVIGIIIFASMFLINFSESFMWLKEQFGSSFVIPMSIVLGLVLTVYLMLFTSSNIDFLEKYLHLIYKRK